MKQLKWMNNKEEITWKDNNDSIEKCRVGWLVGWRDKHRN